MTRNSFASYARNVVSKHGISINTKLPADWLSNGHILPCFCYNIIFHNHMATCSTNNGCFKVYLGNLGYTFWRSDGIIWSWKIRFCRKRGVRSFKITRYSARYCQRIVVLDSHTLSGLSNYKFCRARLISLVSLESSIQLSTKFMRFAFVK